MQHKISATLIALAASGWMWSAHAHTPAQWQAMTSNLQVSLEQAVVQASQAVAGQVIDIEVDDGDGAGVRYEAKVLTPAGERIEVWVDGQSGQARQHEHDGKAKRKDMDRAAQAKIDIQQAIAAATQHTPGKAVKAELDSHWGKTTYQVDVLQADYTVMEVKLDAADGSVIRSKKD